MAPRLPSQHSTNIQHKKGDANRWRTHARTYATTFLRAPSQERRRKNKSYRNKKMLLLFAMYSGRPPYMDGWMDRSIALVRFRLSTLHRQSKTEGCLREGARHLNPHSKHPYTRQQQSLLGMAGALRPTYLCRAPSSFLTTKRATTSKHHVAEQLPHRANQSRLRPPNRQGRTAEKTVCTSTNRQNTQR